MMTWTEFELMVVVVCSSSLQHDFQGLRFPCLCVGVGCVHYSRVEAGRVLVVLVFFWCDIMSQ